jgi:Na+-translocating ferredoxin:NAD+ oxidoreductase RnfD subunit
MTTSALPRPAELTSLPHSGLSVTEFYSMHFMAAIFPLTAGILLYGWRAATAMLLVGGGTVAGIAVWKRIRPRGRQLSLPHALWLALLLAMMLPAHLASDQLPGTPNVPWYLLPAAGLILAMFMWVLGGLGAGRISPVLVTYLLIAALCVELLVPHWVLQRNHLLLGDLLQRGKTTEARYAETEPWTSRWKQAGQDSEESIPASEPLSRYTRGREKPPRGWLPIQSLLRDDLPPLEDLIVGGQPAPIGTGSAIAVIIGGLFLLYRGLIDFRIPLIILLVEFAALLILPTPVMLSNQAKFHWIISREPEVGWATGITFANYEMMASPSLFMAFFLATAPSLRPMSRRARVIYAFIAGAGTAALQLYMSVSVGPYVALLLASLLTPALDLWFRPRPLV